MPFDGPDHGIPRQRPPSVPGVTWNDVAFGMMVLLSLLVIPAVLVHLLVHWICGPLQQQLFY